MGDAALATNFKAGLNTIVGQLGKSVTIKRTTKGALIDPAAPSKGYSETVSLHSASVIISNFDATQIDGTVIQTEDKQAVVDLNSIQVTPTIDDLFIDGSDTYKILNVNLSEIAGVSVSAELHLRK